MGAPAFPVGAMTQGDHPKTKTVVRRLDQAVMLEMCMLPNQSMKFTAHTMSSTVGHRYEKCMFSILRYLTVSYVLVPRAPFG